MRSSPIIALRGFSTFTATGTTSSSSTTTKTATTKKGDGEDIYQRALEALKQVEIEREEREKQKAEELHRAIERAEAKEKEHADNPKAKNLRGVTVVKTVVKQTKKETKRVRKQQQQDDEESSSSSWEKKAHELLSEAAMTYGHPKALILLGNGALQQANQIWIMMMKQEKEEGSSLSSSDSNRNDRSSAIEYIHQALDYYKRAGQNGASEGWFNFGQLLWTGYPAAVEEEGGGGNAPPPGTTTTSTTLLLECDLEASMEAFRKAIELGDPDAMYFVGVQQLNDENNPQQQQQREGLELIESAAQNGQHGPARYYLSLLHLNGHDGLNIPPCSPSKFVDYLNAATDTGDAEALFLRGHSYHQGDNGYPLDYTLALQDFLAAARAGSADAAVSAGAMLHQGRPGVPVQQSKAFELYQRAGEMGSQEGWRNVVACYALGEGVPKSEATARYIAKTMLNE